MPGSTNSIEIFKYLLSSYSYRNTLGFSYQGEKYMKWIAIILPLTIIFLFYLMSDGTEQELGRQITQEKAEPLQEDTFEKEDGQPSGEASWQNQRAEKIMGLGTGIN